MSEEKKDYDYVNPNHYKKGNKEVWQMMVDIWGKDAYIAHCEMCAFKYRMRLGDKPGQSAERDLEKAKWYEDKAKELRGSNLEGLRNEFIQKKITKAESYMKDRDFPSPHFAKQERIYAKLEEMYENRDKEGQVEKSEKEIIDGLRNDGCVGEYLVQPPLCQGETITKKGDK